MAGDFVHPNEAGHLAIAIAMLHALGEQPAAERLVEDRLTAVLRKAGGDRPSLSYELMPIAGSRETDRQKFRVRYWWTGNDQSTSKDRSATPARVTLSGPGWEVQPAFDEGSLGEFVVTGVPEHRQNLLTLQGTDGQQTATREVKISAPWLVAAGLVQPFWPQLKFDPAKARTPVDEAIEKGGDFTAPIDITGTIKATPGQKLAWQRYFPSVNFTGLDAPGSVDFAAITHARNFEAGYRARWVYSPRERPVRVALGTQTFAGDLHLTVFLNGQEQYRGQLTAEPKKRKEVDARLRQGWNVLVCKANHCTWQWQYAVDLVGVGDDSLDELRYSTVPQTGIGVQ